MPFRRNIMIIAGGVLLAVILIVGVSLIGIDLYVTHDEVYANYDALVDSSIIKKGWIPEFVPRSARDIRVTHDIILSEQRIKFGFDSDDLPVILDSIDRVSKDAVRFPSTCTMWSSLWQLWWPKELLRGSEKEIRWHNYIFYVYEEHRAYLAIEKERPMAWYWRHGR